MLGEIDEHFGDHLLILRERIDSAPEWPFDHLTRARFVGLMWIPGASWVGSAVLERLIL